MDEAITRELESERKRGAVLRRLGGLRQVAAQLTGGGLPKPIRTVVEQGFGAKGHDRHTLLAHHGEEIGEQFGRFSPGDWSSSIRLLLPDIAPTVESACTILTHRPYQRGSGRKPFRAPHSKAMRDRARGQWLLNVTFMLGEYERDIIWVAERSAALAGWSGGADMGWLLAGALEPEAPSASRVMEILQAAVDNPQGGATMGRHVIQAMLSCSRPDGWEFVERLLLAAQRQEGLRQVILESVDEAHPAAFRRMLRVIREENLSRFSSVVRAADTWFGFLWDGASGVKVDQLLDRVLLFLDDPSARAAALGEKDAEVVYLALWAIAFDDVHQAIAPAARLLSSASAEIRFVATHFLVQCQWSTALPPLVEMLADPDLHVATRALDMFHVVQTTSLDRTLLFNRIEQLLDRGPARSATVGGLVWPWWKRKVERTTIAAALFINGGTIPGERLLPHVPALSPDARAAFIRRAAGVRHRWDRSEVKPRKLTEGERTLALDLLGDGSAEVREAAGQALETVPLRPDEVNRRIDLLARKAGDLRNGALKRLRQLADGEFLAAADRLTGDQEELRRLAGLELLRDAVEAGRLAREAQARIAAYSAARSTMSDQELAHAAAVQDEGQNVASRTDALGLIDLTKVAAPVELRRRKVELGTEGAGAALESLARLVQAHQEKEIRISSGETRHLVESVGWQAAPQKRDEFDAKEGASPLAPVWKEWLARRPSSERDPDGCEFLRILMGRSDAPPWLGPEAKRVVAIGRWSAGKRFLTAVAEWCVIWEPPAQGLAFLLDGLESELAGLGRSSFEGLKSDQAAGRSHYYYGASREPPHQHTVRRAGEWLTRIRWWRRLFPATVQPRQALHLYGLLRAFEARSDGYAALRVTVDDFLGAAGAGTVGEADFIDLLAGRWSQQPGRSLLNQLSTRKPPPELVGHPDLLALVDRCRRRVIEVETQRGDRQTAASKLAMDLRWTGGLETLQLALPALGKSHFSRHHLSGSGASRQDTLSHLVLRSLPAAADTHEVFVQWARQARLSESRLVELAVYAPQWAGHVNALLDWPGLEDAVWWIQAHTKDDRSWDLQEMKEIWAAQVSERTPLSATDLTEGAVDVGWFATVYGQMGADRWKKLDAAAKFAASSGGHTRAQLFARAMAGIVTQEELTERIGKTRHQDSVRALGLLPLESGAAGQSPLLARYRELQEFKRQSRKFGSLRQASEKRAVTIGLENLARTAGFRDPQRLQWAMEQADVADLADGPIRLVRGDLVLTLAIDEEGKPGLVSERKGKAIKALPAALKKDAEVVELRGRFQELKRQSSRVRLALEEAMCRGDRFTAGELQALLRHPILAPSLRRIVFTGGGQSGYLAERGQVLQDITGKQQALSPSEELRIAHPVDLLASGAWSGWQRECYQSERVQPFKQLFRELYPLIESERGTLSSTRYAGHQVNPRQALALLGQRGWVARPEQGVSRTFHEEGLTAWLGFEESFFTPADIEGLTLDGVSFTRKGEWTELPLEQIPPRLFSEAMRDVDLVVSVAHQGGVDPEASASTVEMRGSLLREAAELLGLSNVQVQKHHAVIAGSLGRYSVHLGSAVVMLMPGTFLPIVAVHSQHRGRLFLPFADDDPRTAEVLAKVLLLSRDKEIKDPNILEWIREAS